MKMGRLQYTKVNVNDVGKCKRVFRVLPDLQVVDRVVLGVEEVGDGVPDVLNRVPFDQTFKKKKIVEILG